MAGRSRARLENGVSQLAVPSGAPVPAVEVADVSDADSLLKLAQSSRVLISAVGPFRTYGMPVVAACISGGCHYLDVCGEPGAGAARVGGWRAKPVRVERRV